MKDNILFVGTFPTFLFLSMVLVLVFLYLLMRVHKEKRRCQLDSKRLVDKKESEMKDVQMQFFVKMIHEIRTPLSLVIGPIESVKNERDKMCQMGMDTQELDSALEVMERNADRLVRLVNHFQNFERNMSEGMTLDDLLKDDGQDGEQDDKQKGEQDGDHNDKLQDVQNEEHDVAAQPILLVVEDDMELCEYVVSHFCEQYQVLTASNGLEGLRVLERHQVSLIISDWMMPEMDGAEFCKQIRHNPDVCHIPFVMLTAKSDNDSKVEGMDCGVDIFIEKPFSMKYLKACIRNLMERRKMLQDKYSHSPLEPISKVTGNRMDNEFLKKMNKVIEDNINNPYLSVVFLAEQMGMSRSSLFVKTKALVDLTPNEMIQLVKLKKAASLLQEGRYRVNEVSYMVGFSSPGYFAKCFQKQFGMKPGEFMERG